MTHRSIRVLLAAALLAGSAAHAVPIVAGIAEAVTIRDCINVASVCDDFSAPLAIQYGGAPGAASSSAHAGLATHGMASGSVALSGTVGAPVLHASAFSEPGARNNTNSVALQRYTYTGSVATTRSFGATLTYLQSISGAGGESGVFAAIDVFTLGTAFIEAGDSAESNFDALFNAFLLPGYHSLGSDQFSDTASTLAGTALLDVTVSMNPGDTVWVLALLQTPVANGAWVDASHTLVTGWDDADSLVPAVVAVQEPATLALLGAALPLLLVRGRRRR
jgi:hypothetical protein